MIDHPGLESRGSNRIKVKTVEFDEYVLFALELTQTDRFASGTLQSKVRGHLSYFYCLDDRTCDEHGDA
jgi:hypothetical protein